MSEEQEIELKPEHRLFADIYLTNGHNAYQAALSAGYSESYAKSQSYNLLENVGIKAYIDSKLKPIFNKYEITNERILQEVARLAFSDLNDIYNPDGSLKNINEISPDARAAIAGVETTNIVHGKGDDQYIETVKKVKCWNKNEGLKLLMQYKKLLDGDNQTNINNISISDEQLKRVLLDVQKESKEKFSEIRKKKEDYLKNKKK